MTTLASNICLWDYKLVLEWALQNGFDDKVGLKNIVKYKFDGNLLMNGTLSHEHFGILFTAEIHKFYDCLDELRLHCKSHDALVMNGGEITSDEIENLSISAIRDIERRALLDAGVYPAHAEAVGAKRKSTYHMSLVENEKKVRLWQLGFRMHCRQEAVREKGHLSNGDDADGYSTAEEEEEEEGKDEEIVVDEDEELAKERVKREIREDKERTRRVVEVVKLFHKQEARINQLILEGKDPIGQHDDDFVELDDSSDESDEEEEEQDKKTLEDQNKSNTGN